MDPGCRGRPASGLIAPLLHQIEADETTKRGHGTGKLRRLVGPTVMVIAESGSEISPGDPTFIFLVSRTAMT
jgi:hypothetical protein